MRTTMATHATPESETSEPRREQLVRRLFDAVYGTGELYHVDDLVAPDYVGQWPDAGDRIVGPAGVKTHATRFRLALARLTLDIDTVAVENDTFVARWTASGYLERPYLGVDPTGHMGRVGEEPHGPAVTLSGVTRGTFRSGSIVESRTTVTLDSEVSAAESPPDWSAGTVPSTVASLGGH